MEASLGWAMSANVKGAQLHPQCLATKMFAQISLA